MVTKKCLDHEIRRLFRLPFAPSEAEEVKPFREEFERVLRANCVSDLHCTAVVTAVMDGSVRFPAIADLVNAAREVQPPEVSKAPAGCETCNGTGFRSYQRKVAAGYVADIADFCTCPKGSWMRSAEQQRETERAAKAKR